MFGSGLLSGAAVMRLAQRPPQLPPSPPINDSSPMPSGATQAPSRHPASSPLRPTAALPTPPASPTRASFYQEGQAVDASPSVSLPGKALHRAPQHQWPKDHHEDPTFSWQHDQILWKAPRKRMAIGLRIAQPFRISMSPDPFRPPSAYFVPQMLDSTLSFHLVPSRSIPF